MSDKAMVHSGASASIPVEGGAMPMLEKAARVLATAMGYDFDAAFDDKSAWIKAHGDNGAGFVDVNEPFKCDFIDGAKAVLSTIREPTEVIAVAGCRADDPLGELTDWRGADVTTREAVGRVFTAMIDHILNEAKQ